MPQLRHSFGSTAVNASLSTRELQAWMGHADARTTARYSHYRERGDEAARLAAAYAPLPPAVEAANPFPARRGKVDPSNGGATSVGSVYMVRRWARGELCGG